MSNLDLVKFHVSLLEQQLGVKRGGRLFWLYVANWMVSMWLVLFFAFGVHWLWGLVVGMLHVVVVFKVNVTEIWNSATEWREKDG